MTWWQSLACCQHAITLGMWPGMQGSTLLKLPSMCPPVAARIFYEATKLQPSARPSALEIVNWLREG